MTRIAFMGTPEFAVPSLNALHGAGYEIVGVFTQPDRPAGRGNKLTACPVKARAQELGLPIYQFERLKAPEGVACLQGLRPDLVVTAAFGQILTQALLDIPTRGTVNVHASLLPKHRGSAPINQAILSGDSEAGVSIMLTDIGVDTGAVLSRQATPIGEMETAGELTQRLSVIGAQLLLDTLPGYLEGSLKPVAQDASQATYEPMLTREDGEIDWSRSAVQIARQVRGLNPWPGTHTELKDGKLKLFLAKPVACESDAAPGTVIVSGPKTGLIVKCGEGALEILEMQAPNAKRMAAKAYLMGKKIEAGTRLGKDA